MRTMLKSKIHRARVTDANVDYEGSVTIDKKLMEEADILPYEQVHVLDVNNGARFITYAIEGESGEICGSRRSRFIKLAAGSDSGGNPYGRHGKFYVQLEGLVQCGLSPLEAIRAATTAAAELMSLSDEIGTIAPGRWADILVVDGDPLNDISSFRRLSFVVAAGRVFRLL